jgi:uncharacterized membrane protein
MVRTGKSHWREHPAVDNDLTLGERAADVLKHTFGTWSALFTVGGIICFWILAQTTGAHWDKYPYILLNLCLSCLAAVQGIILQISANRQGRINAEAAGHDHKVIATLASQSTTLLQLQEQQMGILTALGHIDAQVDRIEEGL